MFKPIIYKIRYFIRDVAKIQLNRLTLALWSDYVALVLQMPKTGSASVNSALIKADIKNVYHLHTFVPAMKGDYQSQKSHFKYPYQLARLLLEIVKQKDRQIKIFTGVRDPIARNLSDFFQLLKMYEKWKRLKITSKNNAKCQWLDPHWHENLTQAELQDIFLNYYPYHEEHVNWFQDNIDKTCNINVYNHPFDHESGYLRIQKDNADVLIFKTELHDKVKAEQLNQVFGTNKIKMCRINVTETENFSYNSIYKEFVKNIQLPVEYIEKMYTSQYAQHFFTAAEIAQMKSKWMPA